jgi:hypothetical protein
MRYYPYYNKSLYIFRHRNIQGLCRQAQETAARDCSPFCGGEDKQEGFAAPHQPCSEGHYRAVPRIPTVRSFLPSSFLPFFLLSLLLPSVLPPFLPSLLLPSASFFLSVSFRPSLFSFPRSFLPSSSFLPFCSLSLISFLLPLPLSFDISRSFLPSFTSRTHHIFGRGWGLKHPQ